MANDVTLLYILRVTLEPSSSFTVTAVTPAAPSSTDSQSSEVGLVAGGLCLQVNLQWWP